MTDNDGEQTERLPPLHGRVAVVVLTEAHVAGAAALGHAHVVHQPEVDVEAVRAGPPHTVLGAAHLLHELDTAALALLYGRHVLHGEGEVERVLAPATLSFKRISLINAINHIKMN